MARTPVADTPEFHVVVRRPNRRGPLAPYRFAITVVFALLVSGAPLWRATETGEGIDRALIRLALTAVFAWILLGQINKILASANVPTESSSDDTA